MKNIEKEVRYSITEDMLNKIKQLSEEKEKKVHLLDITCGKSGFSSLKEYGYICRIRQKAENICLEVKQKQADGSFMESKIDINSVKDGMDFFSLLSMKPYLWIERNREIREYKGLKVFIDEIDMLGNFVEIEYQDVDDEKILLEEFIHKVGIVEKSEGLYGDIFKFKIENDNDFRKEFEYKLNNIIK